ncbi:ultraviolet-B receptor UVR8 isoform X2 [Aphidius gifuensis]|nr:ultraviolet-B receptor UVR8 isoform X2 [Aphidius gifuensis]
MVPDHSRIQSVIAGKEHITFLTEHHEIWQLNIYTYRWNKIDRLISNNVDHKLEYVIKIGEHTSVLALTNLGRIFNVHNPVKMPKNVKFTDFACGLEHAIMLTDDGDIYSMGMGTKGQLGHENLENCNEPELIRALAGLKIAKVSAGGWHSAVVTVEGDLYTWGWNKNGELGIITNQQIINSPTLVIFNDKNGHVIDIKIKEIECGNCFSVCRTDEGELWGCGSNKYGQLTQSKLKLLKSAMFVKLDINYSGNISNFYCTQFGSIIKINE